MKKIMFAIAASLAFASVGAAAGDSSSAVSAETKQPAARTHTFTNVSNAQGLIKRIKASLSAHKVEIVDISSQENPNAANKTSNVTVKYHGNFDIATFIRSYKNVGEAKQNLPRLLSLFKNRYIIARVEGSSSIIVYTFSRNNTRTTQTRSPDQHTRDDHGYYDNGGEYHEYNGPGYDSNGNYEDHSSGH